jgi:ATP-dependent RNA helicase DeaD
MQVHGELHWLYADSGLRVAHCVGGNDIRRQMFTLAQGTHVVVGTPGRLVDLLERGALDLSRLKVVVLDEADEMLDMGFREDLEMLLESAPIVRRTLLFSATLPDAILHLAKKTQADAVRIDVQGDEAHADIEWRALLVHPQEREHALVNVLRHLDPPSALVFVATREGVHQLSSRLMERGFTVAALSGEFTQAERTRSLQALRDGRARVLVATDVAARGLDVPHLGLVVHADPPIDSAVLLHRSGRTGRAGRKGIAVILVPANRERVVRRLVREAGVEVKWTAPPSAEQIRVKDQERLIADLAPSEEIGEEDRVVARALLAAHDPEALVANFVRARREQRPAPEELPRTLQLGDPSARPERPERADRGPRRPMGEDEGGEGVWFWVNLGHRNNANPRWLIPMLCRRGGVEASAIGRIRIMDRECRVEIHPSAAEAFEEATRRPDKREPHVRIARYRERR